MQAHAANIRRPTVGVIGGVSRLSMAGGGICATAGGGLLTTTGGGSDFGGGLAVMMGVVGRVKVAVGGGGVPASLRTGGGMPAGLRGTTGGGKVAAPIGEAGSVPILKVPTVLAIAVEVCWTARLASAASREKRSQAVLRETVRQNRSKNASKSAVLLHL